MGLRKVVRTAFLAPLILCSTPASAAENIALVIGVRDYEYLRPLRRSPNDAEDVAKLLEKNKYKVLPEKSAQTLAAISNAVDAFVQEVRAKSKLGPVNAVIYYSGHGVEAYGGNWLLGADFAPKGKKVTGKKLFEKYGYPITALLEKVRKAGASATVVILDACRDQNVKIGKSQYVQPSFDIPTSSVPESFFLMYAAGKQSKAYDTVSDAPSASGRNSVFTRFLLRALDAEPMEISALANRLQKEVYEATVGRDPRQVPASYDQIIGDHYIIEPTPPAEIGVVAGSPVSTEVGSKTTELGGPQPLAAPVGSDAPDDFKSESPSDWWGEDSTSDEQNIGDKHVGDKDIMASAAALPAQEGPAVGIFFRDGRIADAQELSVRLKNDRFFYHLAPDDFSQIQKPLAHGSYRIVRLKHLPPAEEKAFDRIERAVRGMAQDAPVSVIRLEEHQLTNKPYHVQLF